MYKDDRHNITIDNQLCEFTSMRQVVKIAELLDSSNGIRVGSRSRLLQRPFELFAK